MIIEQHTETFGLDIPNELIFFTTFKEKTTCINFKSTSNISNKYSFKDHIFYYKDTYD